MVEFNQFQCFQSTCKLENTLKQSIQLDKTLAGINRE